MQYARKKECRELDVVSRLCDAAYDDVSMHSYQPVIGISLVNPTWFWFSICCWSYQNSTLIIFGQISFSISFLWIFFFSDLALCCDVRVDRDPKLGLHMMPRDASLSDSCTSDCLSAPVGKSGERNCWLVHLLPGHLPSTGISLL